MATATGPLLFRLQNWLTAQVAETSPDEHLLDRFVQHRDEGAFRLLLDRHGPMVLRVCRRQLKDNQDAEDAFQATFLVLASRAAKVRKRTSLAAWLHGVAYRVASRLRRQRRPASDVHSNAIAVVPPEDVALRETVALLDEELCGLPLKYRVPLVLCHLQGLAQADVAVSLGVPLRTLEYRLAQGRERLRRRLVARGVQGAAVLLALEIGSSTVSASLVTSATVASLAFVEGEPTKAASALAVALAKSTLQSMHGGKWLLVAFFIAAFCAAGAAIGMASLGSSTVPEASPHSPAVADQGSEPAQLQKNVDFHGDPLPEGAVARLGTVRLRQGDAVRSLQFTPDGKKVLSRSFHQPMRLWDVASGKELRSFGGPKDIFYRSVLSPDGKLLAAPIFRYVRKGQGWGTDAESLRVWDVETGKEVGKFGGAQQGHYGLAFSPDSKVLATGAADKIIRLWDLATGQEIRQLQGHEAAPVHLLFSPDGKLLAAQGYGDNSLRLWDVATGKVHQQLTSKKPWGGMPAFTPDGKSVVAIGEAAAIIVWDTNTGKELRRFPRSFTINSSPQFVLSPDGQTLLTVGEGNVSVRVWELATGKELMPLNHSGKVMDVAWSPDSKHAATTGDEGKVRLWNVAEAKELHCLEGHRGWIEALAMSPDGKRLASGGNDATVRLWDTRTTGKQVLPSDDCLFSPYINDVSPDARTFVTQDNDGTILLWDLGTGKVRQRLPAGKGRAGFTRFSPDGRTMVSTGSDRILRLWDVASGTERAKAEGHFFIGGFAPDSKGVAVATDGGLRLLDVENGKDLRSLPAGSLPSFAPDGKLVALAVADEKAEPKSSIRVYRLASGKEVGRLEYHAGAHGEFAISPDGKTLVIAASDREGGFYTVRVLELATLKERLRFRRPTNQFNPRLHLACAPGGRFVATGADEELVVWDLAMGKEAAVLTGHRGRITGLRYSANGSRLSSWGYDNAVLVWDTNRLASAAPMPRTDLAARDLDALWADLAAPDAGRAQRGLWRLAGAPDQTVPFLRKVLKPVPQPDVEGIKRLIADLDDNQVAVRRKASADLEALGEQAEAALQAVLAGKPSLELRRRAEALLDKLDTLDAPGEDGLRVLRAIEVLEQIGTPDARRLLEDLSRGGGGRQTREAKAALERLARRGG